MNKKIIIISIISILLLVNLPTTLAEKSSIKTQNNISTNDDSNDRYAVIMVGRYLGVFSQILNPSVIQNYYNYYTRDAARMYKTLRDVYGYSEENIFLLVKQLPGFQINNEFDLSWIDYTSSEENLEMVLFNCKKQSKDKTKKIEYIYIDINDEQTSEEYLHINN